MSFVSRTTLLPRRSNIRVKSCTECRRRKQRCIESKHGPCWNCSRRFPTVECVGRAPSLNSYKTDGLFDTSCSVPKEFGREAGDTDAKSRLPLYLDRQPSFECDTILDNQKVSALPKTKIPGVGTDLGSPAIDSLKSLGSHLTEVNCTNVISVNTSERNSELFYFFQQTVAPFMFALAPEGQNIPIAYQDQVLPEIMQSPLMPHIAIFTASAYRAHTSGTEMITHTPTMLMKGRILRIINSFLEEDFDRIHQQVIQSVLHLIIMEWYCYDLSSLQAHMKGLREMIKLRGGISTLQSPLLRQLLILTDYELACGFERDLYLLKPHDLLDFPISSSYPESHASPLVEFSTSFFDICEQLELSHAAASILDSMRAITLSILALSPTTIDIESTLIRSHAFQINANLTSLPIDHSRTPSFSENIYIVIYFTALAYTSCISSGRPFKTAFTDSERTNLYNHIKLIPLQVWKRIPGIYLWILLVACPGMKFHAPFLLKSHIRATSLYISFTDFGLVAGCFRGFWRVMMWIKGLSKTDRSEEVEAELVEEDLVKELVMSDVR